MWNIQKYVCREVAATKFHNIDAHGLLGFWPHMYQYRQNIVVVYICPLALVCIMLFSNFSASCENELSDHVFVTYLVFKTSIM